jgi:hypothetical protein
MRARRTRMSKEIGMIDEISKVLTEFALAKFPVNALEVKGPVQEGSRYRWRIVSTRYNDVTVLLKTRKLPFSKPTMTSLELYGLREQKVLKPDLRSLQDALQGAELVPVNN